METTINLKTTITPFWKDYLIKYTDVADVAKVSEAYGVGYWTLNKIRQGVGNISNEKNQKAIEALVKAAIDNAESRKSCIDNDITEMVENIDNLLK